MNKKKQSIMLIDTPLYSYWQALYLSFFSRSLYVDIAKCWRGYGILYFLLLSFIVSLPLSLKFIIQFNNSFAENIVNPLKNLPDLYIQNGKITVNEPMPYYVKNQSGEVIAIVDTTGVVKEFDSSLPKLMYLFTKDNISTRRSNSLLYSIFDASNSNNKTSSFQLDENINMIFNGKKFVKEKTVYKLKLFIDILIYPLFSLLIFSLSIGALIFFIFLGQLATIIIFKFNLNLKDSCRIFTVASTPVFFLFFASLITNFIFPWGILFYIALIAVYYSFAALSIRAMSKNMVYW